MCTVFAQHFERSAAPSAGSKKGGEKSGERRQQLTDLRILRPLFSALPWLVGKVGICHANALVALAFSLVRFSARIRVYQKLWFGITSLLAGQRSATIGSALAARRAGGKPAALPPHPRPRRSESVSSNDRQESILPMGTQRHANAHFICAPPDQEGNHPF